MLPNSILEPSQSLNKESWYLQGEGIIHSEKKIKDPETFLYVAQPSIKNNEWTNFIP